MGLIIKLLVNTFAIIVTSWILRAGVKLNSFWIAILVAIVFAIINTIIKPIILLLTLPINILTLGLFGLVINALLVLLVSAIVPGFRVENFWWALGFSILLSIVSTILHLVVK